MQSLAYDPLLYSEQTERTINPKLVAFLALGVSMSEDGPRVGELSAELSESLMVGSHGSDFTWAAEASKRRMSSFSRSFAIAS